MKKLLLFIPVQLVAVSVFAQPILTSTDLNSNIGDVFVDVNSGYLNEGAAGADVIWDLSAMTNIGNYQTDVTSGSASYPATNRTLTYSNGVINYLNEDATGKFIHALDAAGTVITYQQPGQMMFYPFEYEAEVINSFACTFNSGGYDFDRSGFEVLEYDGYGTLITPAGTFNNVVRLHLHQEYTDESIVMDIDYVVDSYSWYIAGYRNMIASVSTITSSFSGTQQYGLYAASPTVGLLSNESEALNVDVYPNPSVNELFISQSETFKINKIDLITPDGRVVNNIDFQTTQDDNVTIDMSTFATGSYILVLQSSDGKVISKQFIKN